MTQLYDNEAPNWRAWTQRPDYLAPLRDALDRGLPRPGASCLVAGAGTGPEFEVLAPHFNFQVHIDLSIEMLKLSQVGPRVMGDLQSPPFRIYAFDTLVYFNSPFFLNSFNDLLSERGTIVWANSHGAETPIYVSPLKLGAELRRIGFQPLFASIAGWGEWMTFQRSGHV